MKLIDTKYIKVEVPQKKSSWIGLLIWISFMILTRMLRKKFK